MSDLYYLVMDENGPHVEKRSPPVDYDKLEGEFISVLWELDESGLYDFLHQAIGTLGDRVVVEVVGGVAYEHDDNPTYISVTIVDHDIQEATDG